MFHPRSIVLAACAIFILASAPAQSQSTATKQATTLLVCQVQTDSIGEFLKSIERDPLIDCTLNTILRNQFGCPLSDEGRHRRWKRLLRTDLLWMKRESLNRAEFLAAASGISLR